MEEYPRPRLYGPQNPHPLYSVTKSFSSALIGIAIKEGFIDGVLHKVLDFFPNRTFANMDSQKEAITLEHLLTMTSGLPWDEWTYQYGDPRNDATQMMLSSDPVQFVLDRPMVSIPGTTWVYNGGGSHLLSAIVNETTGTDTEAFAREHLFNPLGISNLFWGRDPFQRIPWGFMGLDLTPLDMAKFGYLYLNNGTWDGQQIIQADWVTESARPHFSAWPGWRYGYQWWIGPRDNIFVARGYMGQNIIVAPDYNIVVVFTGSYLYGPEGVQLFYDYILPAVGSTAPDDYPTIQEAINDAAVGDVIVVRPGTYYEHIVVNKAISLVGEDVSTTIIDGNNTGHVIDVISGNANITGFTVRNGGNIAWPDLNAGICLNATTGCVISKNRFIDNGFCGISLLNSQNNNLSANYVAGTGWGGIHLLNSSRNTVSGNTLENNSLVGVNGHALSHYNNITENVISNSTYGMFYHASRYNRICGNNISEVSVKGIWFQETVSHNIVAYNNLVNCTVAISLEGPNTNNTLSENFITGAEFGIKILNSQNNHIANNVIMDNFAGNDTWRAGIRLEDGGYSRIDSNIISGNYYGVLLYSNSPNVSMYRNNITYNEFGLRVASGGSHYLNATQNVVANNVGHGIGLTGFGSSSNFATISRNTITNNSDGIALGQYSNCNSILQNNISRNKCGFFIESSSQNTICSNNIVENDVPVNITLASTNSWDNGCEGNYWSNYNGSDLDDDGIGDTSLPWEGVDNCPLMNVCWNLCDINHDLNVNMTDIINSATAFGTVPGHTWWNPHADITGPESLVPDGRVDMRDISLIARHFGEHYP
jgi:parallel beta-helix repeat protein